MNIRPDYDIAYNADQAPTVDGMYNGVEDRHSDLFFAAVETTRMPMTVVDPHQPDSPIIFANHAFIQMTGYSRNEIVGKNCRFLQGPETDRETIDAVRDAISREREIAVEVLNYRKNGSSFWNALFISPVYGKNGELVYFFGSQLDVSRRRDAEDSLRQSQKMEALGQLTGGIAHDFNNLLQIILGYVDTLKSRDVFSEDQRTARAIENIGSAAQRATTLTQQLLAFARKQRLEGRPVNLNTLVTAMSDLASRTLGGQVVVETKLDPGLWNCRLDPVQTEVALLNIMLNARDAMPGGGRVTIATCNQMITSEDVPSYPGIEPGAYAGIAITDTGSGMPPDILARVMDPFFTTKEEGKGTGLGLSMVYGFAKQSGGAVRIYSEVGQGTTVRLFFPATDQSATPLRRNTQRSVLDEPGDENILVVEDRMEVAELAQTILEDFGYKVSVRYSGASALEFLDQGARVDLIFSDLIMPGGMNGVTLAREARKRQPKIKVLLTTGYAESSIERTDGQGVEFEMINKPYRRTELARRVRSILNGPTGVG